MNTLVTTATEVAIIFAAIAFYVANMLTLIGAFDKPFALMLLS